MANAKKKEDGPTIIKKYANRRLYDTGRSSYVTLEDLCLMVKENHEFVVHDAKTGEDLTHQILTQIIADQESKGEALLPNSFLRQLIGFYGDNLQGLVPRYLEQSFEIFTKNQEQFREQINKSMGGMGGMINPAKAMEELTRQNMALFENAMRAWTPFAVSAGANQEQIEEKITLLKDNITKMQKEMTRLMGQG